MLWREIYFCAPTGSALFERSQASETCHALFGTAVGFTPGVTRSGRTSLLSVTNFSQTNY